MHRFPVTFAGVFALFAWIQSSELLFLSRDVAIYNGSLAVCVVFAFALLLYALLNRFVGLTLRNASLVACAATAAAFGFGYALCSNEALRLALFCLQAVLFVPLAIAWGARLSAIGYKQLFLAVCAAGAASCLALLALASIPQLVAALLLAPLPPCSALCLIASADKQEKAAFGRKLSGKEKIPEEVGSFEPLTREDIRRLPGMMLLLICACSFLASLFAGLTTSPYVSNSFTILVTATAASLIALLLAGTIHFILLRVQQRAKNEDPLKGDDQERSSAQPSMQAFIVIALVMLVGGLLLFSMKLPGTMTTALGLAFAAKNCLLFLGWIAYPRAIAEARLPFVWCFSLLLLACGELYAEYLGAGIGKVAQPSFVSLTSIATVFIAAIAILAIVYMFLHIRRLETMQRVRKSEEAAAPPTFEDIRNALRAHQLSLMEPYGLTEREREITLMIVDGQTMGGIAEQLFITERTVKFHSKNAYDKLGVHNKKELMQMFSDL